METRPLGKTGLTVTRMGLGMAALGRPGYMTLGHADDLGRRYDPAAMEAHAHAVLDAAYAAGIRYFDVARSYGQGERFLASWLLARDLAPGRVTVGSKWGYTYTAGWQVEAEKHEIKEHSLAVLRRQIGESRALLGRHLVLYHIHSATLDSGVLDNADVIRELARLRSEGLVIGLSVTGARQSDTIRRAMEIVVEGVPLFGCVQATWNVLEPSAGPALAEAHAAGLGVIVKEAARPADGQRAATTTRPSPRCGRCWSRPRPDSGRRSTLEHGGRAGTTVAGRRSEGGGEGRSGAVERRGTMGRMGRGGDSDGGAIRAGARSILVGAVGLAVELSP